MNFTASAVRQLLVAAALGSAAVLAAGCGTTSSNAGSPGRTATVTTTPSSGTTPASPPSSPSPSEAAGPPECTTAALAVKVGSSNGAAGTIYYSIDFTNVSASNCFVQGYPGVSLVSAGSGTGHQIGAAAGRDAVITPKPIVLAPGRTANAQLGVAEAANSPVSSCHPVTAHWLKVFPPDQTVAVYAPLTTATCASASVLTLHIAAITAGA